MCAQEISVYRTLIYTMPTLRLVHILDSETTTTVTTVQQYTDTRQLNTAKVAQVQQEHVFKLLHNIVLYAFFFTESLIVSFRCI